MVLIENDLWSRQSRRILPAPREARILSRAPGCCDHFFDEETVRTAAKTLAINCISVTTQPDRRQYISFCRGVYFVT